jgi:hypothetical protein
VLGGLLLVLVMAFVFPPLLFGGGLVVAALLGHVATKDAEARYEGSEWVDLSKK